MALIAPTQQRSVDPYSDNRFSSVINRLSRIVTGGADCILLPRYSYYISRESWNTIKIYPGFSIKDDVLLHITEEYDLDVSDDTYYIDNLGAMVSSGYYYIVLQYKYARTLPAPLARYRIIRETSTLYTGYEYKYIFLAAVQVVYNSGESRYELESNPNCIYYNDPINPTIIKRVYPEACFYADGGELV